MFETQTKEPKMILNIGKCPLCKERVRWDTEEEKCIFVKSSCLCECPFPKEFMDIWRAYTDFIDIHHAYDLWKTGYDEGFDAGYEEGHRIGYHYGSKNGYLDYKDNN